MLHAWLNLRQYRISIVIQYKHVDELLHDKCVWTIYGDNPGIVSVDGGAGNGKTYVLGQFLGRIIREEFQLARSILVCGVSDSSIDRLAKDVRKTHKIGLRYKTNSDQRIRQKIDEHKIVFTTLEGAVDLIS